MFTLKEYQKKSLKILSDFLEIARFKDTKEAYDEIQYARYGNNDFKPFQPLEISVEVPYVCLRLPTGGGKTLLSAYTVDIAGASYIENDYPLTLWLVPTNIIKQQTLETLKDPKHSNYQVLEHAYDGRFSVFDISDFRQIRPQDISNKTCIIVSTFASLRVDNTDGRKVYDHDENLEPHFSKVAHNMAQMERNEKSGKIKFSFANLLSWHRPLVIVDEAHNAKSDLSIEVLKRVNAACVVEYTATPASNSNVIHSVTAAELKAEEMIKLPINLVEHLSWEQAVTASIQTRQKLEELAHADNDYIRPIILFQAENKGQLVTVDEMVKYLTDYEGIDRSQIAIATGEQKELDAINLFDVNCPIRYVITVQALKEGWDCSFAYVLCSVANTKSKTAIEQLLGRVLRMPYAESRIQEELNQAYAHVSSQTWPHAVTELHDRLVNMGFEKQEADEFIYFQPALSGLNDNGEAPLELTLTSALDLSGFDHAEKSFIEITEVEPDRYSLKVKGIINENLITKLSKATKNKKDKSEIVLKGKLHLQHQTDQLSPSQKGEIFKVPQLCFRFDDDIELAEKEICLGDTGWSLLDYYTPLTQDKFKIDENARQYQADISGQKIIIKVIDKSEQLNLEGIQTELTDTDLCLWLNKKLKQTDIQYTELLKYLQKTVRDLLNRSDIDMPKLVRGKFILEKMLALFIYEARAKAYKKGFQASLFGPEAIATIDEENFSFTFDPENYPTGHLYEGALGFSKHYYPRIGAMNNEEAECAQVIDSNPLVKFWVRNLERQPKFSFWLPTSTDKFYPDFVAQLNDGRLFVIEYKGAHLNNDDTKEKKLIGHAWAEKSNNLFLMVWKKDPEGRNMNQQIENILAT